MIQLGHEHFRMEAAFEECRELRRRLELDGLPSNPDSVEHRFCEFVSNCEGLYALFGGQVDKAALDEAYALVGVIRTAAAKQFGATHTGTTRRH